MPGKFANAAAAGEFVDFSERLHVIDTGKGGEEPQVQLELTEGHHLAYFLCRVGALCMRIPFVITTHTARLP